MIIDDAKELGRRVKSEENEIIVEADLGKKIFRIKVTGKVVWAFAIGAICVAIAGISSAPATGPVGPTVSSLAATPALLAAFGSVDVAMTAIWIAISGGVGALNRIYHKYTIKKQEDGTYVLQKKR